jgi:hypothetical protein
MDIMYFINVGKFFGSLNMAFVALFLFNFSIAFCHIKVALRAVNPYFQVRLMVKLKPTVLNNFFGDTVAYIAARGGVSPFGPFEMTCETNVFVDFKMFFILAACVAACASEFLPPFQVAKMVRMIERYIHLESRLFL